MIEDPAAFVRDNTAVERPALVPEIALHLASEVVPLWQATEADLAETGLPPPFWAFAWAGGQALARFLLDEPDWVAGKRVLDFAAGSGVQGIAAALAGAARVEASEIDRFALAALALNAEANGVALALRDEDVVGLPNPGWEVVLAGDVCYERPMAERVARWLGGLARGGVTVLLGDPGRSYLPKAGLTRLARYAVPTTRELEDSDLRNAVVWQVTEEIAWATEAG
ncbi:MAG: 50S ribosomal protein L11 methyltransferase [Kiloniellales bacterium]|nr:50S ribosomal protein L11 methyltransferase [Kiloniellales bacterium]